jgi:hypothetical protein
VFLTAGAEDTEIGARIALRLDSGFISYASIVGSGERSLGQPCGDEGSPEPSGGRRKPDTGQELA